MVVYNMRSILSLGKANQRTLKEAFGFNTIRDAKKSFKVDTNTEAYELMRDLYNLNVEEFRNIKNKPTQKKTQTKNVAVKYKLTKEQAQKGKELKRKMEMNKIKNNVMTITAEDTPIMEKIRLFKNTNVVIVLVDNGTIIKSVQHDIPSNFNNWWKKTGYYIFFNGTDHNDGFFSNYPDGKAYIYKEILNIEPKQITQYFKEGNTNCLLTPIMVWAEDKLDEVKSKKSKERYKTIMNKIEGLMTTYHNEGVNENIITDISTKLQIDISIYKPLCDINYIEAKSNKKALKHFKYLNTKCGHIDLNELVNENDCEIVSRDRMFEISKELIQRKTFFHYTRDLIGYTKIISLGRAYRINNSFREFINDFEVETGLVFCKIDDIKDKELSRFINMGTHYNATTDFQNVKKINTKTINHIDMEKAYIQYKMSKYYQGFLGKITDFRKCDSIQGVGLYQIKSLFIPEGKFKTLNDKMGMYKSNNVYTSAELNMLTDNGATYIIECGAWGIKPLHFDLHDDMFLSKYDMVSGYAKYIGMCDIHSLDYKTYMSGDIDMFHLIQNNTSGNVKYFEANTHITRSENGEIQKHYDNVGEICVSYPKKSNFHLGHITAFITAYQRLNALEQLLDMDYSGLVRICVDGIYYQHTDKMHEVVLHNCFRHKESLKLNNESGDCYVSNIYKYLEFKCGNEREFNINELHIGEGGNGKTHINLIDEGLVRPLYVAPSWKLSTKKQQEYDIKNNVWANIYSTDPEKISFIKTYHNTLIIDEVSMMSEKTKNYILETYSDLKLIFCGDVGFQAPCFEEGEIEMTYTGFAKVIEHHTNYRFKCDKLKALIYQMRDIIKKNNDKIQTIQEGENEIKECNFKTNMSVCNLVKECLKSNTINRNDLKDMYKIDDMILARTHQNKDEYTEMFNDMEKWYVKENTRSYKNGQIIIGDKPVDTKSVLQHAYTIHSIQGETARHKLFIDMSKYYDARILYTAISRAITLDQIYLIM
jgi:hypothetical protein